MNNTRAPSTIITGSRPAPSSDLDRLMTAAEVLCTLRICRATLYNLVRRGRVPEPLKFGRASRWRNSDIARIMDGHPH